MAWRKCSTKPKESSQQDTGLLTHLAGLASVAITNARTIQEQRNFFSHILEVLSLAIESLGPQFHGHPWRSQRIASLVARRLELPPKELSNLAHASLLHDVGFLGARVSTFTRGFNFNFAELGGKWDPEYLHPVLGEKMLSGVEIFKGALPIIRHHHEAVDGTGYPDRLKGNEIPIGSRILALVEVIENIRYQLRNASPEEVIAQAKQEVSNLSGSHLDPKVVGAFLEAVAEDGLTL